MEPTHVHILSGNRSGQVLEVGRDIRRDEAEIDVATGFAEWARAPVRAVPPEPLVVETAPRVRAGATDGALRRGSRDAHPPAPPEPAAVIDPAMRDGADRNPHVVARLGGGWYELSNGEKVQLTREDAGKLMGG